MLTIIIAVASSVALCLCSVCIYVRRNKKTVEALQDILVAVMTAKKAERWSEERLPGGPKVTFAPGLQLDTKRRCSTKHVGAKLTRSLSNNAVRKAIKTAEVMNAEAGDCDVDTPNPDPSSAASSPGFDAPGRYTSRRGRDSFAEDLTMEAATKSEHPSGRMTTRAAAAHLAAKMRRRNGGDESRRGQPTPSSLPRPGAVGSRRLDHNHGIVLQDLDSRPASLEASPLPSAFRRSSVAKFFSSDEDGEGAEDVGMGAGFRLGLSPRAAPEPTAGSSAGAATCRFWMIKADFLRTFSGTNLPFFQELRAKHPSAFVEVTISYEEVVCETHVEKILSISHRWMVPTQPDPDGEQLKAIKAFLDSSKGKRIELVWIDSGSMPQDQPEGTRTKEDTADFKTMLSQVCAALCRGHRPFLATLSPRLSHLSYLSIPALFSPVHLRTGQHALPRHYSPHRLRPLVFVPLLDAV